MNRSDRRRRASDTRSDMRAPSDQPRFEDLLRRVMDATTPEVAPLRELEALLRADPELRREYVTQMHVDALLAWELGEEGDGVLAMPTARPLSPAPRRLRHAGLALSAAAAVALVFGAGMFWGSRPTPPASSPAAAVLIEGEDCEWLLPAGVVRPAFGSSFFSGESLHIASGVARLAMRSRAGIAVEGPAQVEVLSGNEVLVRQGRVSAYAPEEAIGFRLLTPGVEILDLGTRFAAQVMADGSTDVHVFEGEVSVQGQALTAQTASERVTTGQARRYAATGSRGRDIALAPEFFAEPPDLEQLLAASPGLPETRPANRASPAIPGPPHPGVIAWQNFLTEADTPTAPLPEGWGFATASGWANTDFTRLIPRVTSHAGDTHAGGYLLVRGRDKAEPNIANRLHRRLADPLPASFHFALRASYHGLDATDFFALWLDAHGREDASHGDVPSIGLREGRFFARLDLDHVAQGPEVREGETFTLIGQYVWDAAAGCERISLWVNADSSTAAPLAVAAGPKRATAPPPLRFAGLRMGKDTEVGDRLLVHQIVLAREFDAAHRALSD